MKCFAVSGSQSDYMVPLYQWSVPCNLQSSVNITISPFGNDVTRLRGGSPSSMPLPGIIDSMARLGSHATRIQSHDNGRAIVLHIVQALRSNRPASGRNRVTPDSQYALHTARQPNFVGKYVSLRGTRPPDASTAALINKWGFDLAAGIIEELTMLDRPIVRCFAGSKLFI